jgi:predicted enzyme related to lactoylglutathione lyase
MELLVNIDVPDLASGIAFYTRAFDLSVRRRLGASGVELVGGSSRVYLLAKPSGSATAGAVRTYARHWTPVHLDFVVGDVDTAVSRAVEAGAVVEAGAEDTPWGRIAVLADPFGHGVCVVSFNEKGYDAITTS